MFFAVGSDSLLGVYSYDGYTWTSTSMGTIVGWYDTAWNGAKWVSVNINSRSVTTSPDGITWTQTDNAMPTSALTWYGVTYGLGKFVAVSSLSGNSGAYSTDGLAWTRTDLKANLDWEYVTYGNGAFVACPYGNPSNAQNLTRSTDGITWAVQTSPYSNGYSGIVYNGTRFFAPSFSADTAITSSDGITWSSMSLGTSALWYGVAADYANRFILTSAAGYNAVISPTGNVTTRAETGNDYHYMVLG